MPPHRQCGAVSHIPNSMSFLKKLFGQDNQVTQPIEPIFPGESFSISKITLQDGWGLATFNNKYIDYPNKSFFPWHVLVELEIIEKINCDIEVLKMKNPSIKPDRLDMDLAIIFHKNLKKLKWGRFQIDDHGTWRWMSINFFLNQVKWRWTNDDPKNEKLFLCSTLACI